MPNIALFIIFTVLMLPGIVGIFLPILPGIAYMFTISLIFAVIDKFQHLNWWELLILMGIAILSLAVDYASGIIGAKYGGASKKGLTFGVIGMIVGLLLLPPFGAIAGLFFGILLAEILAFNDHKKALKAATGGVIGSLLGIFVNFLLGLGFLALFIIFALK